MGEAHTRPKLHCRGGGVFHIDNVPVRVVVRPGLISAGCTDVTPEALRALLAHYDANCSNPGPLPVVIQEGSE
jgi:hypothetical protein